MFVDFEEKEITLNKQEAAFIRKINDSKPNDIVSLSVYWDETYFERFLRRILKLSYRGCTMDTAGYLIPTNFKSVDLSELDFNTVVGTLEFTESCYDRADVCEHYSDTFKITAH